MEPVAVVTGSAKNLGRKIVLDLAANGFNVVVSTRTDLAEAHKVAEEAERHGVRAASVKADVTSQDDVNQMFRVATSLGDLRVLVNNASLRTLGPIDDLDLPGWRAVHAVTLDGAFLCIREALPAMRRAGSGRIVNILGGHAWHGDADRVHVSAAKHGLWGLTLAVAQSPALDAVTVNAVSPTGLRTDNLEVLDRRRQRVANVVTYLASPDAAAVNGQLIEVDCARSWL